MKVSIQPQKEAELESILRVLSVPVVSYTKATNVPRPGGVGSGVAMARSPGQNPWRGRNFASQKRDEVTGSSMQDLVGSSFGSFVGFLQWGTPIAGWFVLEKPISIDKWLKGVPPFQEPETFRHFSDLFGRRYSSNGKFSPCMIWNVM